LDEVHTYSRIINRLVKLNQDKEISHEIENRKRLISISMTFQKKTLGYISENKIEIFKNEDDIKDIIKLWEKDLKRILSNVKSLDIETMKLLESNKNQTTKEIATVFSSKNKLQGYDLSNVK
jgi:hypothetical protein